MEIKVDKYGSANCFSVPLTEAIKDLNEGDTLVFENKEYHLFKDFSQERYIHFTNTDSFKNPKKYFGMLIENKKNFNIEGNGATLVIHGDICSLGMINCQNVNINNLTIRYASPNCSELKVIEKKGKTYKFSLPSSQLWYIDDTKKNTVVFFEQSPYTKKNYWEFRNDENSYNGVYHGADGNTVYRIPNQKGVFSGIKSMKRLSATELEIKYRVNKFFKVGDILTNQTNKNRNTCGIFFGECANVKSTNITVNYMAGFGWLSQMCENMSFDHITFKGDKDHIVSSFADLIHICGCKGDVTITNSYFSHAHDDCINIHGSFMRFKEKVDDHTAVFEFVHNQQGGHKNFFPGDKAKFYRRTNLNELPGDFTVKAVVDDLEGKTCKVTFNETLPQNIGEKHLHQSNIVIENKTYCPNVEISDCVFTAIPTRDILCTTSGKVRIHHNIFEHSQMAHIFISDDSMFWYESGPVRDVEIYENKFLLSPSIYSKCPAILIKPITFGKMNSKVHENITIRSNYFLVGRDVPIRAKGVTNLDIYSNTFNGSSRVVTYCCKKSK